MIKFAYTVLLVTYTLKKKFSTAILEIFNTYKARKMFKTKSLVSKLNYQIGVLLFLDHLNRYIFVLNIP